MTAVRLTTTAETPDVGMPENPPSCSVLVELLASGCFVPDVRVSMSRFGAMP